MSAMTLSALIDQSAARLENAEVAFGHGTLNAFDEAVWLTLWRLGLPLEIRRKQRKHPLVVGEALSHNPAGALRRARPARTRTRQAANCATSGGPGPCGSARARTRCWCHSRRT